MNFNRPGSVEPDEAGSAADEVTRHGRSRSPRLFWGLLCVLLVAVVLAVGGWRHSAQSREVAAIARASQELTPEVRVETVQPSSKIEIVSLPATTSAFTSANIFARASGYIAKREVDIGDRVKAGQLLAE